MCVEHAVLSSITRMARPKYLEAFWQLVDWAQVEERLGG